MTLGIFLPLLLAAVAIVDLVAFRLMLARGKISERMFAWLALASVSLPFVAAVLLQYIMPQWGTIEVL